MSQKKKPDHIVYNEETGEYDAKKKAYPTSLSAPAFKPVIHDNSNSIKASKYFKSKMDEIKAEFGKDWVTKIMRSRSRLSALLNGGAVKSADPICPRCTQRRCRQVSVISRRGPLRVAI